MNQASSSGTGGNSIPVVGRRTGVSADQGSVTESGPGSAGQTGLNRPNSGGGFSTVGQSGTRVGSSSFSGSSFGGSGGRVGGSAASGTSGSSSNRFGNSGSGSQFGSSRNDNRDSGSFNDQDRRFRPSSSSQSVSPSRPLNGNHADRPGLFNPTRTEFSNRASGARQAGFGFNSQRGTTAFGDTRRTGAFGGGRQPGAFGSTRPSGGFGSASQQGSAANAPIDSGQGIAPSMIQAQLAAK